MRRDDDPYFAATVLMADAIARERSIKERRRVHRIELIEACNPHWLDLYPSLV